MTKKVADPKAAKASSEGYVHGYSSIEQDRLKYQAQFTEQSLYGALDLSQMDSLLEVGVGVGAQSEILLRRYPNLRITGIDQSEAQLKTAREYLASKAYAEGRYDLKKMDATNMEFDSLLFDGAFICWVLEHVPSPERVLSEVRRVLKRGAKVYITEVMNHSFFLEPYSPNVWKYWMAFNDFLLEQGLLPWQVEYL